MGSPFEDATGHGSHVASYAVGASLGVASSATLVSVKWRTYYEEAYQPEDIVDAFEWVYDNIIREGRQGKAVVLFPAGEPTF